MGNVADIESEKEPDQEKDKAIDISSEKPRPSLLRKRITCLHMFSTL